MTTKILTVLIAAAVLAGSAAAALQATDASLAPGVVSARTGALTSGRSLVVAAVPAAGRFAPGAGGFAHGARWIVVLTPTPSSAAD